MNNLRALFIFLMRTVIRGYQLLVSPVLPKSCRYYPSCSTYAADAVQVLGPVRGTWMAVRRIARCHPWAEGGFDPVPGSKLEHQARRSTACACHPNAATPGN